MQGHTRRAVPRYRPGGLITGKVLGIIARPISGRIASHAAFRATSSQQRPRQGVHMMRYVTSLFGQRIPSHHFRGLIGQSAPRARRSPSRRARAELGSSLVLPAIPSRCYFSTMLGNISYLPSSPASSLVCATVRDSMSSVLPYSLGHRNKPRRRGPFCVCRGAAVRVTGSYYKFTDKSSHAGSGYVRRARR